MYAWKIMISICVLISRHASGVPVQVYRTDVAARAVGELEMHCVGHADPFSVVVSGRLPSTPYGEVIYLIRRGNLPHTER